ncbi:methylesterase 17 [Gossypium arboreum]|uniref:methylesterase 17 n=1 Tax=Gossypium arboreum TaxID=29729 RepID=UPI00081934C8|nr:methylesterase 17 [Gossypium arboreum]XP_017639432.1 methylesterase 17 [Gossypium arboreum]XP_017639433.1 methylesterase 17 [Gossypium arboreum]XP_017639434.1 methylesterase 17 [Gossypium arboreum]XP_017639435.1 methylesterase 17 [Gossypium arboreum]XP_017639436.1 methylesterase 17 [Gossypium arboreum]XP_052882375.1 methylesterase 17 [Gossypium arboreum]
MSETTEKLHFVMVHGFGHGAWCWYKIRSLLEASDYKVSCIDLKGSGMDPSDPNSIFSFQDYNKPLIDLLSNLPHNEKVILVGHSAGGMSLTYAIHRFSQKIRMAIYVAATMLKHGFVTPQDYEHGDPDLSIYGDVCKMTYGLGADQPPTSMIIKEEFQRKILYHLSPIEDSTLAAMLVRAGPLRALVGVQFREGGDADSVPRVFIKTLQDRVLKQEQQEAMLKKWPPALVFALESDHCPFFSMPTLLFAFLLKAVASIKAAT